MTQTKQLTSLQIKALTSLRDGTRTAVTTLKYQGIKWRTLDSLYERGLVDRSVDNQVYHFRINEAGRDAHYRRPTGA